MPSAHLSLREEDVVRLALEFLHNRDMHISQLSLERETGVINGSYSDDVLFLRQLILDGQWDDVLEFIQPLESLPAFDMKKFKYYILRRKYEELLCIKSEATLLSGTGNSVDNAVEEVVKVLRELEKVVPTKDEYSHLCLLLTLPKLNDHLSYKDWNPSHARVQCFREILPIVEKFLPNDKKSSQDQGSSFSKNDRLIQLVIKGILYESCVNYCQSKATGTADSQCQDINFTRILDGNVGLGDSDLSLISWLQCVPSDIFSIPFEQRTLNVDVEKLDKPTLETSWTEHMLVTPIKPKTFPHSAMPFTRPRSAADVMSRSLLPAFEGLGQGLAPSRNGSPLLMALSTGEVNPHLMTRSSFASFHLTGFKNNKLMNTSVDRLFENDNEEVFLSTTYADFQPTTSVVGTSTPKQNVTLNRKQSKSPDSKKSSNVSTTASSPDQKGKDSPSSTARSSRRDSLVDKPVQNLVPSNQLVNGNGGGDTSRLPDNFDGDLMKEFQKQKQKFQEAMIAKGKQREELLRQIQETSARDPEECSKQATELSSNRNAPLTKTVSSAKVSVPVNGVSGNRNSNSEVTDDQYDVVKDSEFQRMATEASALRRLEALFENVRLENEESSPSQRKGSFGKRNSGQFFFERAIIEERVDQNCDIHGRDSKKNDYGSRRGSMGNILHSNRRSFSSGVGSRRDSMPALHVIHNHPPVVRRDSGGLGLPPARSQDPLVHPSSFPSSLRKNSTNTSTGSLKKDSTGISTGNLRGTVRRDSISSIGSGRRDSSLGRRFSTDSLEHRRNSWDPGRRGSSSSSGGFDETIFEGSVNGKPAPLDNENGSGRPKFVAVTTLEDVQAVRCAEFHPSGKVYAIGSNSKTLRICAYPKLTDLREEHSSYQPAVLFKRTRHHKGSIYCMAWTPIGDLMATGSNDKTVKLMKFNPETSNLEGQEIELTMHDGTVRDLCFLEDTSNKSSLLISGGAGDCKIYVTDCATGSPYQALGGHGGHVLSLYNWGGAMFVSGSQDKTVRFWDLRVRGCVNMVTPVTAPGNRGSPVAAVCVDPSGRLLVSGHEDSSCVLYDIRGGRNVQCFKPHSADIRSIRFSPSAYYLLTGGYDNKLVLTDLQGDLTLPLPSVVVAQHQDKVISGRWHPTEFSFLSSSADKTCTLWALPPV